MSETYTGRCLTEQTVRNIQGNAVNGSSGLTAIAPPELSAILTPGDQYAIETLGSTFGRITGWLFNGTWYGRKSDQQLNRERHQMVDDMIQRNYDEWLANRKDWNRRVRKLPKWAWVRINSFFISSARTSSMLGGRGMPSIFELNGLGYELVVCELAVLYDKAIDEIGWSPDEDSEPGDVLEYAKKHGTTGNQHSVARALVRAHRDGHSLAGTISALAPITGDTDYTKDQI